MECPDHSLDVRGIIAALGTMYILYSKYLDLNSDLKVFKKFSYIILFGNEVSGTKQRKPKSTRRIGVN